MSTSPTSLLHCPYPCCCCSLRLCPMPCCFSLPAGASPRTSAGAPHAMIMHPTLNPATKAPWIPEPALAFGDEDMQFQPVTAHTGPSPGRTQQGRLDWALNVQPQLSPLRQGVEVHMNVQVLAITGDRPRRVGTANCNLQQCDACSSAQCVQRLPS